MSYVCCEPIAGLTLIDGQLKKNYPDGSTEVQESGTFDLVEQISKFLDDFEVTDNPPKLYPTVYSATSPMKRI